MRKVLLTVVMSAVVLASVGCFSAPCTLIGCIDTANLQLGASAVQHFTNAQPVLTKVCVGAQCATETLTVESAGASSSTGPRLMLNSGTLTFQLMTTVSGPQTVTLELTKNGAVVFSESRDGVTFTETRPNGPLCAPVCQTATVTF
jgi:hypothetical protein